MNFKLWRNILRSVIWVHTPLSFFANTPFNLRMELLDLTQRMKMKMDYLVYLFRIKFKHLLHKHRYTVHGTLYTVNCTRYTVYRYRIHGRAVHGTGERYRYSFTVDRYTIYGRAVHDARYSGTRCTV